MFDAKVDFADGSPLNLVVQSIRSTSLHRHPGVLEIVFVLSGELRVDVSCETFDLEAGDFAVLNHGDPHSLDGSADNVTAILHLDLAGFRDVDPFVETIIFACESFDLPRFRKQEGLLRGLLLDLVEAHTTGAPGDDAATVMLDRCRTIVETLCTGYSLEHYYNRGVVVSPSRRVRYLSVLQAMRDFDDKRNALDLVAEREHFSKSYVSHLVKDVSATSFSDMLTFIRLCRAERMLLTTRATMLEISERCGFSDVKYFTRGFMDWFHQTPVEYRKARTPRILKDDDVAEVSPDRAAALVGDNRRRVASDAAEPKLSITPLLLKNVGSGVDLFDAVRTRRHEQHLDAARTTLQAFGGGAPHLVPIRVTQEDIESGYVLEALASFAQINALPCLVVQYSSKYATLNLMHALAGTLVNARSTTMPVWLVYPALHDRFAVDEIVARIDAAYGVPVQAILTS